MSLLAKHKACGLEKWRQPCRLLQRTDWFTQEKACRLLTAVLEYRPNKGAAVVANGTTDNQPSSSKAPPAHGSSGVDSVLVTFVDWLCSQLRHAPHALYSQQKVWSAEGQSD